MKYTGRTERVATILEAAHRGATKTKIMNVAFVGYNPLRNTFLF